MEAPQIVVDGLRKIFSLPSGPVTALDGVSFEVSVGEFFCLVGPSGCGKTTVLRILAGLETKSSGNVTLSYGQGTRPRCSMVFQEQSVFPWMTVRDNIAFGLRSLPLSESERRDRMRYYVDRVGLNAFADAYPHQLSGGMKQRVSIARAFATDPEVLLMDEPFAALDEQTKLILQEELVRIWEETRKTVVYITHGIEEALSLGDRIAVMTARPGRVKAIVPVEFGRPRNLTEIRREPRFGERVYEIWSLLKDEVASQRAAAATA